MALMISRLCRSSRWSLKIRAVRKLSNEVKWRPAVREALEKRPDQLYDNEQLQRIFSLGYANQREINKVNIQEMIKQLQSREGDIGSTPVQIGIMTVRIKALQAHNKIHPKDKSSLRRLLMLLDQRKHQLRYLKRIDLHRYHSILKELDIKPLKSDIEMRYLMQLRKKNKQKKR